MPLTHGGIVIRLFFLLEDTIYSKQKQSKNYNSNSNDGDHDHNNIEEEVGLLL